MNKNIWIVVLLVVVAAIAGYYFGQNEAGQEKPAPKAQDQEQAPVQAQDQNSGAEKTFVAAAVYQCGGGKTIKAEYYQGKIVAAAPGEMPKPAGSLKLTFGDGTTMELAQTVSADGGRYANGDESFVFWDKGGPALVLENGQEKNYTGCAVQEDKQ